MHVDEIEPAPVGRLSLHLCGADTVAGKFLRTFWHPVAIGTSLPSGRAKPMRVLGEDFTLYRGTGGTAYAIDFACAHRCTQLSIGTVDGDNMRCLYHGWMYDGSGQCVEQPAEPIPFSEKIKIRSFPTVEYLGLIFCYFGSDAPPPMPRFPQFEDPTAVIDNSTYIRECNYYQNVDNHGDASHVPFTHRQSIQREMTAAGASGEMPVMSAEETDYGLVSHRTWSDGRRRTTHILMPNATWFTLPPSLPGEKGWSDHVGWRVPIDDECHFSCGVELHHFNAEGKALFFSRKEQERKQIESLPMTQREVVAKLLAGDLTLADVADRPDIIYLEDTLAQQGQGRIVDRSKEHLGRSDATVIMRRKLHLRELRAIAEGRPMKAWRLEAQLTTTSGV